MKPLERGRGLLCVERGWEREGARGRSGEHVSGLQINRKNVSQSAKFYYTV